MVRALVLVAGLIASGCADAPPTASQPSGVTVGATEDLTEPTSKPGENLTLYVSNQSFAHDPVEITVTIDGEHVVRDAFFVEGQHNWITYELAVAAGPHEVAIRSDTGASHTDSFQMPPDGERWAVVNYWYDEPDAERSFSFQVADEPIFFD